MKPTKQIDTTLAPDGTEIYLYEHDGDYTIHAGREQLMSSRQHESERELARLGCERIADHRSPHLLIGGLGMGYTLRQALDMLSPQANITVAELLPAIVRWNRDILGPLCHHPLRDKRVVIQIRDVQEVLRKAQSGYDAILLDVDNGPQAMTTRGNHFLYTREGMKMCLSALNNKGCLAIWATSRDVRFENNLRRLRLHVETFPVPSHRSAKRFSRQIIVASRDPHSLPQREPLTRKIT